MEDSGWGENMAGRHAQPVALIKAKGKSHHITKTEEKRREEAELKLGLKDLKNIKPPAFVENNINALKYWKKHIKEYSDAAKIGIEILTTSDIGMLALYCNTYAEYETLLERKKILELNLEDLDGFLKLESAINKKMDMLIKMQDRLFLNPLARIKSVPAKEKEKPKNAMEEAYDI